MLDIIIACFIGWLIGSFIVRRLSANSYEDDDDEGDELVTDLPPGSTVNMVIHMEEVKGWWYGWFIGENGSETFISQGETYDAALNNCKQRVTEKNPSLNVKFTFEMFKNANATVQN